MNGKKARELRQCKEMVDRLDRRVRDLEVTTFQQGRAIEDLGQWSAFTELEPVRQRYSVFAAIKAWLRGD